MTAALVLASLCLSCTGALRLSLADGGALLVSDERGEVCRVGLAVHGPNWSYSSQQQLGGNVERQGNEVTGSLPMPQGCSGHMRFRQAASATNDDLRIAYDVEFTSDSPLHAAYVLIDMPTGRWAGKRVTLFPSEDERRFPTDPDGPRFSGRMCALVCDDGPGRALFIGLVGAPEVALEDLRRFGRQVFDLRVYLARENVWAGQKAQATILLAQCTREEAMRMAREMVPSLKVDPSRPYALVDETGAVTVGLGPRQLATVRVGVHGPEWAFSSQSDCRWTARYGSLVERVFSGELPIRNTAGKVLRLQEKARALGDTLQLSYRFLFPQAVQLNSYQVSCFLELSAWSRATIELTGDGTDRIAIPPTKKEPFLARAIVRQVRVSKAGQPVLTIRADSPTPLLIQDNRHWGGDTIELRFNFVRDEKGQQVAAGTTIARTFTLSSDPPLQAVADAALAWDAYDQSDWIPLVLPWDRAPVDLSWLNDKPAGKHGKLTVHNGRFVFEDGTPARFWGTCFSAGANFPTHEQSELIARRLAAFGVNIVRTHHADAPWAERNFFGKNSKDTRHFDPDALDRFDYLIYCLKREGIYVYLDQLVHRGFKEADGVDAADEIGNAAKPYTNFDPKLIELQKEFSRMLWQHVNPYTGLAYKDDPAIVLMEFANENDLFTQTVEIEPYRTRLENLYRQWARQQGIQLPDGPVDFRKRTDVLMRFFLDLQTRYYREMGRYLREVVGVQIPMTGSNWSRNAALLAALSVCDYTDSHSYWNHPSRQGTFGNSPAVRAVSPMVATLSFNRLADKPFFVSEWNEPWPNEWRAEIPLYIAAIAALQDWGGLTVYTYAHTSERMPAINWLSGYFETFNDPAIFGLFPHAALIFRRGDVDVARQRWVLVIPEDRIATANSLTPWGLAALSATPEVHQVAVALGTAPRWADRILSPDDAPFPNAQSGIKSDTGQLLHFPNRGLFLIDTPRTQAAIGFLANARDIRLSALSISSSTDFATIAASSLSDDPLRRSSHILLTAVGRVENAGTKYDIAHHRLISSGKAPILCQPVKARVRLKAAQGPYEVYPLRPDGTRGRPILASYSNGLITFDIGPAARTIYYELVSAR